jgi:uncharacterized protein (DUF983 family)
MKLTSALRLRCPVCDSGKIFKGLFDTPDRCPSCGYYFMRESGYFLPHVPIGYLATITVGLGSWPVLRYVFGLQSPVWTLLIMIVVAAGFGVWFLRYAKMLWLVFDLYMHPLAKEDFEARGRETAADDTD